MVRVKIFCMEKDEDDILDTWLQYHGQLVGYQNLYLIDNMSGPTTHAILKRFEPLGIHVWYQTPEQQPDYAKKGDYLCQLIKQNKDSCDLAIPLDLDEFIALVDLDHMPIEVSRRLTQATLSLDLKYYTDLYPQVLTEAKTTTAIREHFIRKGFRFHWSPCPEGQLRSISEEQRQNFLKEYGSLILKSYPQYTITCHHPQIREYLNRLPKYGRYAFSYYLTSRHSEIDYESPIKDIRMFDVADYENYGGHGGQGCNKNKKFFDPQKLVSLDHGNHHGRVEGLSQFQSYVTQLVLFHFHNRGVRKLVEKCKNDIRGLGYVSDLSNLRELKEKIKADVIGAHNIQTYLKYLTEGPASLCVFDDEGLQIDSLAEAIINDT